MATESGVSKLQVKADLSTVPDSPPDEVREPDAILAVIGTEVTVLAESDSVQGRMVITGNGQVLGQFNGEIECLGDLMIGRVAVVTATIRGNNVVIAGTVRGNITVQGRLRISSTGRLEGDARVGSLVVMEGGVHHGVIRVHPEGVPEAAEVEPAAAAGTPVPSGPSTPVERVRKFWGEFF